MLSSLILIVQVLCLSVWIGGTFTLLAVVIPATTRATDDPIMSLEISATLTDRFRIFALIAMIVVALTMWLQLIGLGSSLSLKLRFSLAFVTLGILLEMYNRLAVSASLRARRGEGDEALSRRIFVRSRRILLLNLFCGIAVVITLIASDL